MVEDYEVGLWHLLLEISEPLHNNDNDFYEVRECLKKKVIYHIKYTCLTIKMQ